MGGVIKGGGRDSGHGWRVGMVLWVVRVGLEGNMVMWGVVGKVSARTLRLLCYLLFLGLQCAERKS